MFVIAVCVRSLNFAGLRQVCCVFSPYLFPAFDHFGVLLFKKKQIYVSFLSVCPLIDEKLRRNMVKVYCGTIRLLLVVPQPL